MCIRDSPYAPGLADDLAASGELELLDLDAVNGVETGGKIGTDCILTIEIALDGEALPERGAEGKILVSANASRERALTTPFADFVLTLSLRSNW